MAICDDLFFTAKIRESARILGVDLTVVRDTSVLHQGPPPLVLLLDLNSRKVDPFAALEVVRKRGDGGTSAPAIAFASALDKSLIARAKAAGLDPIIEREDFLDRLPELLQAVTRGPLPTLEVVRGGKS